MILKTQNRKLHSFIQFIHLYKNINFMIKLFKDRLYQVKNCNKANE